MKNKKKSKRERRNLVEYVHVKYEGNHHTSYNLYLNFNVINLVSK